MEKYLRGKTYLLRKFHSEKLTFCEGDKINIYQTERYLRTRCLRTNSLPDDISTIYSTLHQGSILYVRHSILRIFCGWNFSNLTILTIITFCPVEF